MSDPNNWATCCERDPRHGGHQAWCIWSIYYTPPDPTIPQPRINDMSETITCTSTHCERRQECASPSECSGSAKYPGVIYIMLSPDGEHIRSWGRKPFPGCETYACISNVVAQA